MTSSNKRGGAHPDQNQWREAIERITGDTWLDDLARASLRAAEAKFSPQGSGTAPNAALYRFRGPVALRALPRRRALWLLLVIRWPWLDRLGRTRRQLWLARRFPRPRYRIVAYCEGAGWIEWGRWVDGVYMPLRTRRLARRRRGEVEGLHPDWAFRIKRRGRLRRRETTDSGDREEVAGG
jgi:hypothetical protein